MNPSYLPVLKKICQDVRREMANKSIEDNDIEWDVNMEVLFFYAMMGHKPVGVNKHFMMLLIHNKFTSFLNHQLPSKVLWDHLDTMYDMPSLHDSEIIPFPNEEVDFELPEECHDLLLSKHGVSLKQFNAEKESKSYMSLKSSKKYGAPKFRHSSTPVTTTKSSFVTPPSTVNKAHKSHAILKTESKTPATYAGVKFRQEFGVTVKATKLKHSPSLYGSKYSKFESPSVSKEESQDVSTKKKIEKGYSTATAKKPLKVESTTASNTSKKLLKTESNGNGSKVVKTEAAVSSQKKDYSSRKGKGPQPIENAYCKKKVENVNTVKKRNESENVPKKMHESTALKHAKSDIKTSSHSHKGQESETPPSVGSRKSSPVVKAKIESNKKPSRMKSDESVKKVAVVDSAKKVASTDSAKKVTITDSAKKAASTDSAKKVTATDSAKKVAGTSKRRRQ